MNRLSSSRNHDNRELNRNKKVLARQAGLMGYPIGITDRERSIMITRGKLPKRYNFHHIYPLRCGGSHNVYNLAITLATTHIIIEDTLRAMEKSTGKLKKVDISMLTRYVENLGGVTMRFLKTAPSP